MRTYTQNLVKYDEVKKHLFCGCFVNIVLWFYFLSCVIDVFVLCCCLSKIVLSEVGFDNKINIQKVK